MVCLCDVAIAHAEACMASRRAYNIRIYVYVRCATAPRIANASPLSLVFLNQAVIPLCAHYGRDATTPVHTRRNGTGRPRRTRLPITPVILQRLQTSWERLPSRADAVMLWAASTLCFFAFLRMGEAVVPSDSGFDPRYHLAYGDVRINSTVAPSWMEVVIKRSKCDQFGDGVTLSVGATHSDLCPVAAMLG